MLPQFYHAVVSSSDKTKKYRRVNIYEFKREGFPRQSSDEIYPTASCKLNERRQSKVKQTKTFNVYI